MVTPINAIFSRNLIKEEGVENDYFSSNDSEEDSNDLRKKNRKKKRNSILSLEPQSVDIFPDKREDNIKNINELRRLHNSKETKLRNEKIGWNLVYMLLFSDYFNNLRDRQLNNKNNNTLSFFNLKEIELRIKKMINKIKNKRIYDNNINNKDEEKMEFPSPKWIDRPFTSIINDFKYNEKEKNDFIPAFINSFKNFSDNETKKHQRNKSKPLINTFISSKNTQNYSNHLGPNLSSKNGNSLSIPTNTAERKRKSMAYTDPIFSPFTQFIKKKDTKINSNNIKVNSNKNQGNNNNSKGAVLTINFKQRENNSPTNCNNPNIDLLRTNKKFYDMLVSKYPKNEEDILNIKNNFMAYDIELNKNEAIFKRPENLVIKHFFDFHIDNKEKDVKKYNISETLMKQSKIIDNFIAKFNGVMNSKGKKIGNTEIISEL